MLGCRGASGFAVSQGNAGGERRHAAGALEAGVVDSDLVSDGQSNVPEVALTD